MSTFSVEVCALTILPHPNPNTTRLEIAQVGGYQAVVVKGQFKDGELGVYIPEGAIVPDLVLKRLNLLGKLSGSNRNQVKAIRLQGVLSQGLIYPVLQKEGTHWLEVPCGDDAEVILHPVSQGQDVAEVLNIIKYEPTIPPDLLGKVYNAEIDRTLKCDTEDIKRFPNIFVEGEPVVFTEKVHGLWMQVGLFPDDSVVVSSKGFASQGLAFELESNSGNRYVETARQLNIAQQIRSLHPVRTDPYFVVGEVFGRGVQDLSYGVILGGAAADFRVFDIYVGVPRFGRYLNDDELEIECQRLQLKRVPVLYRGPFDKAKLLEHTNGKETVSGQALHIREGIIVKPAREREDFSLGRVMLKSVSPEYLLRKGGTEFS